MRTLACCHHKWRTEMTTAADIPKFLNVARPSEVGGIQDVMSSLAARNPGVPVHPLLPMLRSLCVWALAFVLIGVVSGCALYRTYEKCGIRGCPGDAKITADVLSQFQQHLELEPDAITVQTLDHVVYLYGVVSSGQEIGTAESIASQVPGVTRVVNSMAVQTSR
jgi:hypothetical protein